MGPARLNLVLDVLIDQLLSAFTCVLLSATERAVGIEPAGLSNKLLSLHRRVQPVELVRLLHAVKADQAEEVEARVEDVFP